MQNIHLINSYSLPISNFLHQPKNLPSISSLQGDDCQLLFPDLPGKPISAYYSESLDHYLIFLEDEILIDDESGQYASFFKPPKPINFACLSKSGSIALVVCGLFPNDAYIFDIDTKEFNKYIYKSDTYSPEENKKGNEMSLSINDTDDSDEETSHHQCNPESCTCNSKPSIQLGEGPYPDTILHASFRNDDKFAAVATKRYVQTISNEIYDQQGRYDQDITNPSAITWNPQGSWLAFGNSNKIIFTEKNCRLRQMYELEGENVEPIALSWSPHRDILAFIDNQYRLVILSMKNRAIHRKYVINLSAPNSSIVPQIFWSSNPDELSIAIIDRNTGLVNVYEFNHSVDRNLESIFVIDGNKLLISNWSRSIIPPPLSHKKLPFGDEQNQITAITSNNDEIIVFTLDSIHLVNKDVKIPLENAAPVQCATFTKTNKDVIVFASENTIYSFSLSSSPFTISEIYRYNDKLNFVSFLTPSFVVISRSQISPIDTPDSQAGTISGLATEFVQNNNQILFEGVGSGDLSPGDWVCYCSRDNKLYLNGEEKASNVKSFIFDEKLLAYVYISYSEADRKLGSGGYMCNIQYGLRSTSRQIEPYAQLLFFSRKIYTIISLMNRGNIESNAPHVIVEDALRNLIADKEYSEGWRISKKYQIPFTRFIQLGDIDLFTLCQQIPDTQLRSCMSVLRPLDFIKNNSLSSGIFSSSSNQLKFVLNFLSFILDVEITYNIENKTLNIPPYDNNRSEIATFGTTCCICFVLLDAAVEAVRFACNFNSSDNVKRCITFLLTLYDNNTLYDISLKTYDTKCIASVGLITMKEPSLYVPFIEELDKIENENLKKAKIDEAASDPRSAVIHYALAGPEFDEKALYIIGRDKLFKEGLCSYPEGSETWMKIIEMKLNYLSNLEKREREKKEGEIAETALISDNPQIILQYIGEIVRSKTWRLAISSILKHGSDESSLLQIKEALEFAKLIKEAASFTAQYIPSAKDEAVRLYLQCHEWFKAIENGADKIETANTAFDTLINEYKHKAENAQILKEKFEDVKEKQKIHKDSNIRHGKNKEKRGLPAIVIQLNALLPDAEKKEEFDDVCELLKMIGEYNKLDQLDSAFRRMVQAIYPIPTLPEDERVPVPQHLQGFV